MTFKNWPLRIKFLTGFLLVIGIFAVASFYNYSLLKKIDASSTLQTDRIHDEEVAFKLKNYYEKLYAINADLIINENKDCIEIFFKNAKEANILLNQITEHTDTQEEKKLAKELLVASSKYIKTFDRVVEIFENRDTYDQQALKAVYMKLDAEMDNYKSQTIVLIDKIIESFEAEANAAHNETKQSINKATFISLISIILVSLLGILIALFFASIIINPLNKIIKVAEAISEGDLTKRVGIESKDEIGKMAKVFDIMSNDLHELVNKINGSAQDLAAYSEEMAAAAEQVKTVSTEVSRTVTEIATGAADQAKSVEDTSVFIEEMSASTQEVAANAETVSQSSKNASEIAHSGLIQATAAISSIEKVNDITKKTTKAINALGNQSKEIGAIIDVIKGIADQTNLLSLNAAIEAARAGEHGRGFAVVAEEVRKLAEQSSISAQQIAELISSIQTETQLAVTAMEVGVKEVEDSVDAVKLTGKAFDNIVNKINHVAEQIQNVSNATEEMARGTEQTLQSVNNIAAMVEQTAAGTQQLAAAAQEENASMEEVAKSAQELAILGQGLQDLVSKFKL